MARTPTVYRWDDPGAPDLNAIMPTYNDKNKLFLYTILKACLVDGYAGKSSAGWAMPHEEIVSNGCRFVLTNAANSGSLLYEGGVFSGGASTVDVATLWACSAVSNMDAPVDAWSYKTNYEERNAGANGNFHRSAIYQGASCDAWVVIANENTVCFMSGRSAVEFNLESNAGPDRYASSVLIIGSMKDGGLAGGGGFFISGGARGGYSDVVYGYPSFDTGLLTSNVDIVGLSKSAAHDYTYSGYVFGKTYSSLSAWLPVPIIFMQYGPSAPDGNSFSRLYFSVVLPAMRKLLLHPYNFASLNAFMTSNSFEYGKPFFYQGGNWVLFKSIDAVVDVFSLDPSEWDV